MPEAYIYDHVRTPRGRGKADGALHEVTAVALATAPLQALRERNHLREDVVDDVILGVVDPVGEAGSDIARFAALNAGLGESVPGIQISRFCASGLDAVNFAAASCRLASASVIWPWFWLKTGRSSAGLRLNLLTPMS